MYTANESRPETRNALPLPELGAEMAATTISDEAGLHEVFKAYSAYLANSPRRIADGTTIGPDGVGQPFPRTRPGRVVTLLSPRELSVLASMAEGLGNAAIARQFLITEGAVHKHIRNIFAKLDLAPDDGVDRRVAAVLRYLNDR